MRSKSLVAFGVTALLAMAAWSGEEAADLSIRLAPQQSLDYAWEVHSVSDSRGQMSGKPFTLQNSSEFQVVLTLRALTAREAAGIPASVRMHDMVFHDQRKITPLVDANATAEQKKQAEEGSSSTDLLITKTKVKYLENGKVVVDSDNDIGVDRMGSFRDSFAEIEKGELHLLLDKTGKHSKLEGDAALVDMIKKSGGQSLFPFVPGRAVAVGATWTDSYEVDELGNFKLAKPAVVRSVFKFLKWEEHEGRKLACLEITTDWENQLLSGENEQGMLVAFSQLNGKSTGTCLFDPAVGQFEQGTINAAMAYHLQGEIPAAAGDKAEKESGLDVSLKSVFTFSRKK